MTEDRGLSRIGAIAVVVGTLTVIFGFLAIVDAAIAADDGFVRTGRGAFENGHVGAQLEVHVELNTATKMFCGCATEFGAEPNSQVCPVCLGLPGVLPVLNREAVVCAIKFGLAVNATVAPATGVPSGPSTTPRKDMPLSMGQSCTAMLSPSL